MPSDLTSFSLVAVVGFWTEMTDERLSLVKVALILGHFSALRVRPG